MKKIFIACCLLFSASGMNQTQAQVGVGSIIVDAYYGFPNLYSTLVRTAYNDVATNTVIRGFGPLGVRGEYLLAEKVGVGLDFGAVGTSVSFDETFFEDNGDVMTYRSTVSTYKVGVMPYISYHFVTQENLDFYGMLGAGYKMRTFKYETTNPMFVTQKMNGTIPVAARLGVGVRYFFTENIGANLNVGLGQGGLVNAGVSFKL